MGLFSKLKEKKLAKENDEKTLCFLKLPENAWFKDCWWDYMSYGEGEDWKKIWHGVDITGWEASQILEKARTCNSYKEIKSLAEPGDKKGEEYVRFYEKRKEENATQNGGYGWEDDNKYNRRGEVIQTMAGVLIMDNGFWYDDDDLDTPRSEAPFADICRLTGWDYWNILLLSLNEDPEGTCYGETGYIKFARAVLKFYWLYGKYHISVWNDTMSRLTYFLYDGEFQYGSIIAARFGWGYLDCLDSGQSQIKDKAVPFPIYSMSDVNRAIIKSANRNYSSWSNNMFGEIKNHILANPEYWGQDEKRQAEIIRFIDEKNVECIKRADQISHGKAIRRKGKEIDSGPELSKADVPDNL